MKLLREPPRWLPPLALLAATALILALVVRFPTGQAPEAPAPEFSFRAGGVWYPLGTTETGMLGEPLCVEETSYDAPNRQPIGKIYRNETYGDTQLTYTYSPANREWRLTSVSTRDPNLAIWPGVQVGDNRKQLQACYSDLQGDPPYTSVELKLETEFGLRDFSAFFLVEDGIIVECNLYGDIQGGYTLAPFLSAGPTPLAVSPAVQWEIDSQPRPNSFTGQLNWSNGKSIPLDWAHGVNTVVRLYSSRWSEPLVLLDADELPALDTGYYFAEFFLDFTAEDGLAYRYGASCDITINWTE